MNTDYDDDEAHVCTRIPGAEPPLVRSQNHGSRPTPISHLRGGSVTIRHNVEKSAKENEKLQRRQPLVSSSSAPRACRFLNRVSSPSSRTCSDTRCLTGCHPASVL